MARVVSTSSSNRKSSFLRWWGPLLAYMGFIFWLSSRPRPLFLSQAPDYLLHFLAYFLMGALAVRAFARGISEPAAWWLVCYGAAISLAYALSDEWHQSFVPGRVASVQDLLADGVGIFVSLVCLLLFWRRRARLSGRAVRGVEDTCRGRSDLESN